MADVTISSLTKGIPSGNNILPYSTGSSTLGTSVSALFENTNYVGIGKAPEPFKGGLQIGGPSQDLIVGNNCRLGGNINAGFMGVNTYYDQNTQTFKSLQNNMYSGDLSFYSNSNEWVIRSTTGTTSSGSNISTLTDRLKIASNGAVTMPNQPAFAIQAVQRQYNYNTANWSKITGLSPINQNNINASSTFDFVNSRYVAPVGGIYHISGMLRLDPSPTSWFYVLPYINGNSYYDITGALPSLNTVYPPTGFAATNLSMLIKLNANDILEFYFGASNNNTYIIYPQTCFYGYLLG